MKVKVGTGVTPSGAKACPIGSRSTPPTMMMVVTTRAIGIRIHLGQEEGNITISSILLQRSWNASGDDQIPQEQSSHHDADSGDKA